MVAHLKEFVPGLRHQPRPLPFALAVGSLLLSLLGSTSLEAQARMNGRVFVGEETLTEGTVVLHSVSPDVAGEIDSVRVDEEGRFGFTLPSDLDDEERTQIYFASVRHQGVLYFGEAIALTQQLDSLYVIEVFDSEVAPFEGLPLPLAIRNVVMEQEADGGWLATDLLKIRNDRDRTIVASDSGAVWSHPLPPDALQLEVGAQGDLPPDAVEFIDGRVVVRAPLPPGERLLLIRYRLREFPIEIPVAYPTEVMELLVKEPAMPVTAPPLQAVAAVAIEQSSYRRYVGQNLAATGAITVLVEEVEPPVAFPVGWTAVLFAFVLTGAGLYVYYRPAALNRPVATLPERADQADPDDEVDPTAVPVVVSASRHPQSSERGAIIVEIARLDQRVSTLAEGADEERGVLLAERAGLMERLRARS